MSLQTSKPTALNFGQVKREMKRASEVKEEHETYRALEEEAKEHGLTVEGYVSKLTEHGVKLGKGKLPLPSVMWWSDNNPRYILVNKLPLDSSAWIAIAELVDLGRFRDRGEALREAVRLLLNQNAGILLTSEIAKHSRLVQRAITET